MFKYDIDKMITIQLQHEKGLILQGYEGETLNQIILQAFNKQDMKFIKEFLQICYDGLELEEYFKNTAQKRIIQDAVMTYQMAVDPEGFLKALAQRFELLHKVS